MNRLHNVPGLRDAPYGAFFFIRIKAFFQQVRGGSAVPAPPALNVCNSIHSMLAGLLVLAAGGPIVSAFV